MLIPSERRISLSFYLLQAAALLAVLLPFLRFNNLLEWDFPGHFTAIWHLRQHLLPWPSGWNPYFYCGYPQGMFYPPLAHYLAAILSFPLGIAGAMKVLIAVSVLLLPAVFYASARSFGLDTLRASVAAMWMTAVLFVSGEMLETWSLGSDLRSVLNVGLFANALSLPVLFGFVAACGAGVGTRSWKIPALLLGVLLLIHPLSSLVALIFFFSLAVTRLWQGSERGAAAKHFTLVIAVAFLIGAFWLLPFTYYRGFMNPEFVGSQWSPLVQFIVFNGAILALASLSNLRVRALSITYLLLANFILIGTLWKLDLQFTRLTIYLLFLIPIFLLSWLRSRTLIFSMAGLAVVIGFCGYRSGGIHARGVPDFPLADFGPVPGRVLSVTSPSHLPSLHVNHELIPPRTGNKAVLGLFIESSLNGRFLGNLVRSLEPDAYVWGTPSEVVTPELLGKDYPQYIRDRLRLFDIQFIYTDLKLESILDESLALTKRYVNSYQAPDLKDAHEVETLRRRYNVRDGLLDFYLYPVGNSALAEALAYLPKAPGSDWKTTSRRWFLETRGVPVFTDHAVPAGVREARPGEWVELRAVSEHMDRLTFQIHAAEPIPVLVKIGYFPAWKLTINGKQVPIYRASPNLILIFGKGEAVLEYRRPWQEYAGLALTALGAAVLLLL
jgi:hypothetical protein